MTEWIVVAAFSAGLLLGMAIAVILIGVALSAESRK